MGWLRDERSSWQGCMINRIRQIAQVEQKKKKLKLKELRADSDSDKSDKDDSAESVDPKHGPDVVSAFVHSLRLQIILVCRGAPFW